MRVLLVSHGFPPAHAAGTELYTAQVGQELSKRGHEVLVFTAEKDVTRPDLSVVERTWEGLPVVEVTNNLFYDRFVQTYDLPKIARYLGERLDAFGADIVHVQHLMHLSAGLVAEAARRVPVIFTLHDYWLTCPRLGQRVHQDGSICHTVDHARCGVCMSRTKWGQSRTERRTARALTALRRTTGLDLGPAAIASAGVLRRALARSEPDPVDPSVAARAATAVREREGFLKVHVVPNVERFLAPSRFLRDRMIEWGIRPERIEHAPIGVDVSRFQPRPRQRGSPLRVAFLGTLAPHKGPHVLLDAWARLGPERRRRGQLALHGPTRHEPDYVRRLRRQATAVGARVPGPMPRERVPDLLAQTDLLVVPSTWFENSPLAILEARAMRTPVLASDLGGMAELVVPDVTGWTFRPGDAADLARVLAEILDAPERLDTLFSRDVPVPTVDEDAERLLELYRRSVERRRQAAGHAAAP